MHHKRGRAKAARAGCLMCKPNKLGKGQEKKLGKTGFGNLRKEVWTADDWRSAWGDLRKSFLDG